MAYTDRSTSVRRIAPASSHRVKKLFAATLLLALITALALRAFVSPDALAPAVATLLFASAASIVGTASLVRGTAGRTTWRDVAGVLTFVGIGITILIEPDQMVRLTTLSDQPE